jgi:beta-glucosidase
MIIKTLKITFFLLGFIVNAQSNSDIEAKVNKLLNTMTLKEKIGQMAQINLTVIAKGPNKWSSYEPLMIDLNKARKAILEYKVGSVLNATNNTARSNKKWNEIIGEIQQISIKESRLGIPVIYGIDGIHGATYTSNATMFPQQITTAATWNTINAFNMAKVAAYEIRSCGIPWNFSPVLDLGQDPRFPRQFETFGEDPYLATLMGNQMIKGYQGDNNDISNPNNVAVTLKHFLGYQTTISGKDRTPSFIPEHTLRELHLPAFKSAIDLGAKSIMINSGLINGIPSHADKYILTDILRNELNFKGVVITDWEDINKLHDRDKVASSKKEAIRMAISSGIDMSMIPYEYEEFCDNLYELVNEGSISISRIDESVRRILTLKYELDLFNNPNSNYKNYTAFNSVKSEKLSYESAAEAITLLKNKNSILPLKKGVKILVSGPNSNSMRTLNGAWTYSWQGEKADKFAEKYNTIYEAISEDFGENNVTYIPGVSYPLNEDYDKMPKYEYYDQYEDNMVEAIEEAKKIRCGYLMYWGKLIHRKTGRFKRFEFKFITKKTSKRVVKNINSNNFSY